MRRSWREALLPAAPFVCGVGALWLKQIYFGLFLQSVWMQESTARWMASHVIMLATTLASSVCVLCWTILFKSPSVRLAAVSLVDALFTAVIIGDREAIAFYGDVLSTRSVTSVNMMRIAWHSVLPRLTMGDTLLFADALAMLLFVPAYAWFMRSVPANSFIVRSKRFALCLCGGLLLSTPAAASLVRQNGRDTFLSLQREAIAVFGVVPYHIADAALGLHSLPAPTPAERQEVAAYLRSGEDDPRRSSLFGVAKGSNLVLINAESLQSFPIGLRLSGQDVTPRLNAFAAESLAFDGFLDQTHLGTTSDAEFTVLESVHPTAVGYAVLTYDRNNYYGLPAVLGTLGYQTFAAVASHGDFWNMKLMHPRHGFQASFFEEHFQITERIGPWLADSAFFSQAAGLMRSARPPFFAFLLSGSNHDPYALPDRYRQLRLGTLEGTRLGNYLQSVRYFDGAFGALLDELRDAGLLDTTVVAVYGDHQAFLGESQQLADLLGFHADSELDFFLTRKRVPFLVRLPGGRHASKQAIPGGHLDVMPTLLSLLGVPGWVPAFGVDMTAPARSTSRPVVFRDGSFIDGQKVFIRRINPAADGVCYDTSRRRQIDCKTLEGARLAARRQLEMSDRVLRGDMVQELRQNTFKAAPVSHGP